MFRYSPRIFRILEDFLTERKIRYRADTRFGNLRFSASLDNDPDVYEIRINVFKLGFWVDVPVPVTVPSDEKVMIRMAKFCCRVNLTDNCGGFLVPDPEKEKLVYRLRIICGDDADRTLEEYLTAAPRMVRHYRPVTERLAEGKLSVEKALKILDKDKRHYYSSRLTAPVPPSQHTLSPEQELQVRSLKQAVEDYIRSLEQQP